MMSTSYMERMLPEEATRDVLFSGEIERGKVATMTAYQERQARTVLSALVKKTFSIRYANNSTTKRKITTCTRVA